MYGRKRKHSSGLAEERKSIMEDSSKEETAKLKDKISAMRHHLCLLEFGLGSIATLLLEDADEATSPSSTCSSSREAETRLLLPAQKDNLRGEQESVGKTACGNESCENNRKIVRTIGTILQDVETALKTPPPPLLPNESNVTLASTSVSQNGASSSPPPPSAATETGKLGSGNNADEAAILIQRSFGKDRIYIDENAKSGENVLTGVCNIQLVENASLFELEKFSGGDKSGGCDGLGALSTLASVASTVAIREQEEEAQRNIMSAVGQLVQPRDEHQRKTKRMPKQWRK